jgi:hypothetical protein
MRTIYFATDKNGDTYLYSQKPVRGDDFWLTEGNIDVHSVFFADLPYLLYSVLTGKNAEYFSWENEPVEVSIYEKGDAQ